MRAAKSLNQAQAGGPIGHGGDSFSAGSTVALSGPGHTVGAHPTRWAPSYVGLIQLALSLDGDEIKPAIRQRNASI